MRVRKEEAAFIAANRYMAVKELLLYGHDESPAKLLGRALLASVKREDDYMKNVSAIRTYDDRTVEMYAAATLQPPAYVAQSALDAVLKEGFTPETKEQEKIVAGMLVTRIDVNQPDAVESYFPCHWSKEVAAAVKDAAQQMV